MRNRAACALVGLVLLTVGCRARETSPGDAALTAVTVAAPAPTAITAPAGTIAVREVGFKTPEAVLYDDEADVFLVSNINGSEVDADGNGFISRLDATGHLLALKWIDGSQPGQTLDAPKGMALSGRVLYVADVTSVRMFDRKTGKGLGEVTVPGATFLNDLATAPDGSVYASDSGMSMGKTDLEPDGNDAIYRISGGKLQRVLKDKALGLPNGLLAEADGVWVVTYGSGELYRVTPAGKRENVQKLPSGQLDGIIRTADGSLWISSWEGNSLLRGSPGGTFATVITGVTSPADIALDEKNGRLWIPLFTVDAVEIHSLVAIPGPQLSERLPLLSISLDLFAERREDLDLDEVLRSTCTPLQADEVLQPRHENPNRIHDHLGASVNQVLEPLGTRRGPEAVEIAEFRIEDEVIAPLERLRIGQERNVLRCPAQSRLEVAKGRRKSLQIRAIPGMADVQIVGDGVRAPQTTGEAPDQDEADAVPGQHLKYRNRIETHGAYGVTRGKILSTFLASSIAILARSAGVSRRNSRMRVRSIPVPERGTISTSNPQMSRRRSSVPKRGDVLPSSIREIVVWEIPARRPSSRWLSRALPRA